MFFLFLNFFISIVFNVFNVSTFIRNRLDLSSTRTIIAHALKAILLIGLFYFFNPAVWLIGLATVISTIYIVCTNIAFKRRLTPELQISLKYFDIKFIKELLSAGVWNIVSKFNTILCTGFNLLLANIFIGPGPMGILSITRRIPELTLSLYERINSIFAPPWTKLYAEGKTAELHKGIATSLRFFGFISIIPTAFIFVFSDHFYQLWMPTQDAKLLYLLTVGACIDLPIAMPLQPIYNLYPITNKIKANSIFGLGLFSLTFIVVVIGLNISEGDFTHLMIIASTSAIFNAIKALTFLPLYGAHCVKLKASLLYACILRCVIAFAILLVPLFIIKEYTTSISWASLVVSGLICCLLGSIIGYYIILNKETRKSMQKLASKVFAKITSKK